MEGYLFGALNSCIKIWFDHSISCHCRSNSTSWLERTIGSFIFEVEHVNLQIYTDSVILQLHSTSSPFSSIKSFSQLENFYSQTSCHITTSSECFSKKSGLNKLSVLMRYFMFIFFYFYLTKLYFLFVSWRLTWECSNWGQRWSPSWAECAQEHWPGIYTRVTHFLDWIKKNRHNKMG